MKAIEVKWYEAPNGMVGAIFVDVADDVAEMAEGQVISYDVNRRAKQIFLWSRRKEWDEELEAMEVVSIDDSVERVREVLENLIRKVHTMKEED